MNDDLAPLRSDPVLLKVARILGGREVWVTGGWIRDRLMGLEPTEIDLAVPGGTVQAGEMARVLGGAIGAAPHLLGSPPHAVWRLEGAELKIEIWPRGTLTVTEDCLRRDFSCNALQWRLPGGPFEDPAGGLADVKRRCLRALCRENLIADPVRLLRAPRLMAQLPGFRLDPATRRSPLGVSISSILWASSTPSLRKVPPREHPERSPPWPRPHTGCETGTATFAGGASSIGPSRRRASAPCWPAGGPAKRSSKPSPGPRASGGRPWKLSESSHERSAPSTETPRRGSEAARLFSTRHPFSVATKWPGCSAGLQAPGSARFSEPCGGPSSGERCERPREPAGGFAAFSSRRALV